MKSSTCAHSATKHLLGTYEDPYRYWGHGRSPKTRLQRAKISVKGDHRAGECCASRSGSRGGRQGAGKMHGLCCGTQVTPQLCTCPHEIIFMYVTRLPLTAHTQEGSGCPTALAASLSTLVPFHTSCLMKTRTCVFPVPPSLDLQAHISPDLPWAPSI